MNEEIDDAIEALMDREGGYVHNPADSGGATCFGITEAVARAQGYRGPMRQLPREEGVAIYKRLYWLRPRFDEVAKRSERIGAELFDTGVNMGPAVAATFLQRALTALNRNGSDYPTWCRTGESASRRSARSTAFSQYAARAAERRSSCVRSRRSRASVTCASPNGGQPMKHSFMAG